MKKNGQTPPPRIRRNMSVQDWGTKKSGKTANGAKGGGKKMGKL